MSAPRFYYEGEIKSDESVVLGEALSHYIKNVLRLIPDSGVTLFNGQGGEFSGSIEAVTKKQVIVRTQSWQAGCVESPLKITLAPSVSSREKMDLIIQKAVELGVFSIQPLITERSVVRLKGARSEDRIQHWQKVAISACEQCGRNVVPTIKPILNLDAILMAPKDDEARFFLHPGAPIDLKNVAAPAGAMSLFIGPEGGYANQEVDLLVKHGFTPASLGPRILRMETAAIAALAFAQLKWGK